MRAKSPNFRLGIAATTATVEPFESQTLYSAVGLTKPLFISNMTAYLE
jgi:hypothetical protein